MTLSIHLGLQHVCHDLMHRMGSSVTAYAY